MSHARKQIRDAVVALLPGTVYATRVYPVNEAELPVRLVYTNTEQIEVAELNLLDRRLEVIIECVSQATRLDDELDVMLAATEVALGGQDLGDLVLSLTLASIQISTSAEGSAPIGRAMMTYEAHYRTSFADPATTL